MYSTTTSINPWENTGSSNVEKYDDSNTSQYTQMYGAQESIMFLIDASKQMFEKNIDGIVPMDNALTLAYKWMCDRIISYPKELFSIVFYNSKEKKNTPNEFPHVYVYTELDTLSADTLNKFYAFQRSLYNENGEVVYENIKNTVLKGGNNVFEMDGQMQNTVFHDVLWASMRRFQNDKRIKKYFHCRINILTCNDTPCGTNVQTQQRALKKAEDMGIGGYNIEVYNTNRSQNGVHNDDGFFKSDAFFNELIRLNKSGLQKFAEEQNFDIDLSLSNIYTMKSKDAAQMFVKEKHHSKRISARVSMILNGMNIGVKCFRMFVEQKKPSAVVLSRKTNEELQRETNYLCETTGETLQEADIQLYHVLGDKKEPDNWVYFEKNDMTRIKNSHGVEPGINILGFKPISTLMPYHQAKGSYFLYPDEKFYSGSTKAFTALHAALTKKQYVAMSMFRPSRISAPRLAAIIAQPSIFRKTQILTFDPNVPVQQMMDDALSEGDTLLIEMEEDDNVVGFVLPEKVPGSGNKWKVEIQQNTRSAEDNANGLKFVQGKNVFIGDDSDADSVPILKAEDVVLGKQIQPAGFQALTMPWANEIRKDLSFMTSKEMPKANENLINPIEEIVDTCSLDPFKIGQVKNPNLTKFYKGLKAFASGSETTWNDEEDDNVLPTIDFEQISEYVQKLNNETANLPRQKVVEKKRKAASSTKSDANKKAKTSYADINWEKVYANGQVSKQTAPNLKKFLIDRGHDVTGLKKADLVDKVNEILSDSCKVKTEL
eukprot:g5446.t1